MPSATTTIAIRTSVVSFPCGIQWNTMPGTSATAAITTAAAQNNRSHQPKPSLPIGRQNVASTNRIGYSATQEKTNGAIRPANRPPTMPPAEIAR